MKTNMLFSSLLIFLLTFVLIACNDDDDKYEIKFEQDTVTLDIKGHEETIILTSNGQWQVKDIPEWIEVIPSWGEGSTNIIIRAKENKGTEMRSADLEFTSFDSSSTLTVSQLSIMDMDPFIELDKDYVTLLASSDYRTVKLTTNRKWEIKNIPSWLSVSPSSGNASAEISLRVNEYREPEGRSVDLLIVAASAEHTLQVEQSGLSEYVHSPALSIFNFKKVSFSIPSHKYQAEATSIFVNPCIKEKVFLGNLLSHNSDSNTDIPEITGYTFNAIDVSTTAAVANPVTSFVPSQEGQATFINHIITQSPKNQVSFQANNGDTEFYTYKDLCAIGLINLGLKLDEIVSGSSYTEKEMERKYGLIFSYKQVLFNVDMDFPEKLIEEELSVTDRAKEVSYVSSVHYGRVGLLVVESDTDSRDVKATINKVFKNEPLNAQESALLEASNITHIYFNNRNEVQVKRGGRSAVDSYNAAVLNIYEYVYPVGFSLNNYTDHSITDFVFSYDLGY